jgi:hypothetical protein
MVGVLQSALRSAAEKEEAAKRAFYEIAQREAMAKSHKNDPAALERAMRDSRLTARDYAEAIRFWREADTLEAEAAQLDERARATSETRKKARAYRDQTIKWQKNRDAELHRLNADAANAAADLDRAQAAQDALDIIRQEHPERFGLAPFELDQYTLKLGGTTINVLDSSAPELAVTADVFSRESRRRRELMNEATAEAREAHRSAYDVWMQQNSTRGWDGSLHVTEAARGTEPKLVLPTWREVARMQRKDAPTTVKGGQA